MDGSHTSERERKILLTMSADNDRFDRRRENQWLSSALSSEIRFCFLVLSTIRRHSAKWFSSSLTIKARKKSIESPIIFVHRSFVLGWLVVHWIDRTEGLITIRGDVSLVVFIQIDLSNCSLIRTGINISDAIRLYFIDTKIAVANNFSLASPILLFQQDDWFGSSSAAECERVILDTEISQCGLWDAENITVKIRRNEIVSWYSDLKIFSHVPM